MFNLSPNVQMVGGLVVLGLVIFLSIPSLRNKVSAVFSQLFKSITKDDDQNPPSPSLSQVDSYSQIHSICSALMIFFAGKHDEQGVQFSAAIGQHVYKHEVEEALKQANPVRSSVGPGRSPGMETIRGQFINPEDSGFDPSSK